MAEQVLVQAYFPKDFAFLQETERILEQTQTDMNEELSEEIEIELRSATVTYGTQPNSPSMHFPGQPTATIAVPRLHEDTVVILPVFLRTSKDRNNYRVDVYVWERRLGKNTYSLTFNIA